ncbi:MAG: DUF1223 domain-containing protein [Pseudomonadota bacterium]
MPYIIIVLTLFFASALQANESSQELVSSEVPPVLLELYSSQGCSSCPPAQEWVNQMKQSDGLWTDVIPMVFHVDYWDYLGWRDLYASRSHSQRQRSHYRIGNVNSVYTPGFVVNGMEWTGWFSGKSLPTKKSKQVAKAILKASLTSQGISAEYADLQGNALNAPKINITLLGFDAETKVTRGENARRRLDEDFIVLSNQSFAYDAEKVYPWPTVDFDGGQQAVVVWLSDDSSLQPIHAVGNYLDKGIRINL